MAERGPASLAHSAETSVYAQPRFPFKMADSMTNMQLEKIALIILFTNVFESLNMKMEAVFFWRMCWCNRFFSFRCIVKKLFEKKKLVQLSS